MLARIKLKSSSRRTQHFLLVWKLNVRTSTWPYVLIPVLLNTLDSNFKGYTPVGESPMKRAWNYPRELTRSRHEAEVLAQYRNGGEPLPVLDPLLEAKKIAESALKALHEPVCEDKQEEFSSEPSSEPEEEVRPKQVERKPLGRSTSTLRQQQSSVALSRGGSVARGRENPRLTGKPPLKRQMSRSHLNPSTRKPAQDLTNVVHK